MKSLSILCALIHAYFLMATQLSPNLYHALHKARVKVLLSLLENPEMHYSQRLSIVPDNYQ